MVAGRWFTAVVAVGLLAAACSDDKPAAQDTPTSSESTAIESTSSEPMATQPATSEPPAALAASFEQVTPGGDCMCSDGSEFSFWVRKADPEKVVLFFQGGGACFSAETCSPAGGTYKIATGAGDNPEGGEGVFDFTDARNPFADYSVVFVPYCTGDVHIGNATTEYSPELTVQHKGFVNGTAALDYLVSTFPAATELVVTGESAGSIPSPLYAGLASDELPDARITVLADGSGAYPDIPALNTTIGSVWGTQNAVPDWPENAGLTPEQWSLPGLFIQAGKHDPEITFARHDYAFDETQQFFAGLTGIPADELVTLIDANEAQIEAAGVNLDSYIAPGESHTVLGQPRFYTEKVNGVLLYEWVAALLRGDSIGDVHCDVCTG